MKAHFTKITFVFKIVATLLLFNTNFAVSQNPLLSADQFNIFTEGNLTISQGDIEGAIAVGGNLVVNGNAQRTSANATGGISYATFGGVKYALVVGGGLTGVNGGNIFKVDGKAGATDDHFIRFNTLSGSTAAANGGGIDIGNPVTNNLNRYVRVNSTTQLATSVVNTTQLVNFATAFTNFRAQSTSISGCTGNVTPSISGSQATLNLGTNANNVWNVTGATLNSYSTITLTGTLPSASNPLIINVNAAGTFNWNNLKFQMGSETDNFMETNRAPYILWNFYNATTLTLQNANLTLGSILAPNADMTNNASGNITGQVIAKTFAKPQAGELHIAKFNANVTCATTSTACSCPNNVVLNPSFESGTTSWDWGGGTLISGTGAVACGTKSGDFTPNIADNWVSQTIGTDLAVGTKVDVSVYAGVHDNAPYSSVTIAFFDVNWNYLSSSVEVEVNKILANAPVGPQLYNITATVPSGAKYTQVGFGSWGSTNVAIKTDQWCATLTAPVASCACTGNKILNPSFETNTLSPWTGSNTTAIYTGTGFSPCGTYNAFINKSGSTSTSTTYYTLYQDIPVGTAAANSVSIASTLTFKIDGGVHLPSSDATFRLQFYNGTTFISEVISSQVDFDVDLVGANTLQTYTLTGVVPVGATIVRVLGQTNSDYLKIDNACLTEVKCFLAAPNVAVTNPTCTVSTGSISITSVAGQTYSFDGGAYSSTLTYSGLAAGSTHTVRTKNTAGCISDVTTVTIGTQPVTPATPTLNITQPLCFGNTGSVTLTPIAGLTYSFDGGAFNATFPISGLLAGSTHNIRAQNSSGCISTAANFTLNNPTDISVTSSQVNVLCNGGVSGSINISVTGGTGPYTFNWGAGQPTTEDRTGLGIGTYNVIVTDANGCTKSKSVTITQPNPISISATQINVNCFGAATGSIDLTVSGGTGAYTYNWGAGQPTTQDRTGLVAGTYSVTVTDANNCTATFSATITQLPAIALSTTQVNVNCFGTATGSVDLSVSGGTAPYTYNWGVGQPSTQDIGSLAAGTYSVTVTDANGCTKSTSVTITQLPAIVLSTTQVNVLCNGASTGSIDLTVSGGTSPYTYNWGAGQPTTQDRTGLPAGTYSVTVTDANGCSKVISTTISQNPAITLTTSKVDVLCNGAATGSINLTVTGGTSPYTFNWGTGQPTTEDRTGLIAGTYSVIVTDANNCTSQTSVTITQPNPINISATQINVNCFGAATGSIDLTVSGGTGAYTYNWGAGQPTTQDRTGLVAGTYSVTVTDANNCTATFSATISQLPAIALSTTQVNVNCFGTATGSVDLSVSGGTAPYTYNWGVGQPSTQDIGSLAAGTYSVTVTDANGCTKSTSATITQLPAIVLSTTQVNVLCNGASTGSIDLTVSGGTSPYTYNWGAGQPTTQDRTGLPAGTYSVTVTDANGCSKVISTTISQNPAITLTTSKVDVLCNGAATGSINLTVSGGTSPYTFNWGAGQPTTEDRTGLIAGTYSVIVTDANNCTSQTSVTITQPNPINISATQINVNCFGAATGSIDLTVSGGTGAYTYNWGAGQPTTQDRTGLVAGTYSVTVTDANNCTATFSATISQLPAIALSTTQVNVNCFGTATGSVDLSVSGGTAPYTYNWGVGQPSTQDIGSLAAGTYSVTVTDANGCTKSTSATITQLPAIVLSTTQVNVLCNGASTGSIDLTVSGGTSPYTYNWGAGQPTTQDRTGLPAGTYSVTVTDANGCSKVISTTISQNPAITLTTSKVDVLCNGAATGSINLTVSGGTSPYTFNWGAGQPTTEDRTGLIAGTYSVIVTDANNCTSQTSVTITQPNPISISATQINVNCFGAATGSIDLTVSGGTGTYTYNWGAGQPITQDRTGLVAGTYSVTVTDANNCTATFSATITQLPAIALNTTQVNVNCFGTATGSIDLSVSGGTAPYTYNWGVGQPSTQDIGSLAAGTYSVTVTDANGCTKSTSVTITQSTILTLSNNQLNVLCFGSQTGSIDLTVSGGTSPYTYNWGAGQPTTQDRTGLGAGIYNVIVTDFNGCTNNLTITITQPNAISLTTNQVNILCNGASTGSIDLTVTGGKAPYTFNWGAGQPTTEDRTGLIAGTYSVIVTDANNCTNSVSITITQPSPLLLSTSQINVLCNGSATGSIDLSVIGGVSPYTYNWGVGQPTTQDRTGLIAGTYNVTVTDINGCSKTISATINQPTPILLNTTQVNVICNGAATGSIDLTVSGGVGPYSFNWGAGQPTTEDRSNLVAGIYSVTVTDINGCTKVANVTITQPTVISLSTTQVNILCNGSSTGSIDLSVAGGVAPYTYNWGSGQPTTQDRTGLAVGTYSVIVTDFNLCTSQISVTITQPNQISILETHTNVLCKSGINGSIDISVSGGVAPYTYNWGTGQPTTQDRTGLIAGTYTVIVNDANNCTSQISIAITEPSLLVASLQKSDVLCDGAATGAIDLTVSGGIAPYSYNWGSGQPTSQDRTDLLAGTYSVTVTDANGCTQVLSATINQPSLVVVSGTQINVLCNGANTGSIDLTVAGGVAPYTYNWGVGQPTTQDRTNLLAGNYSVTVTDANGCTKISNFVITEPTSIVLSTTQVNILCNGSATGSIDLSVTGGVAPYTYNWGAGHPVTQDRTSLLAGTYTVIVTDANGCSKQISATITQPQPIILTTTQTNVLCNGASTGTIDLTVIGGTSPYTYNWGTGNPTTQDRSGLAAGTYSVTVTDANNCISTISATITQPSVISVSSSKVDVLCNGAATGSIDITVSGGVSPYTYNWGSGQPTTQDRSGLLAGTYTVIVSDANNCTKTLSVTIAEPTLMVLSNSKINVLCNGLATGSIDLTVNGGTAGYTYLWSNGATSQDISSLPAGTYTVTVTDANGCIKSTSVTITQPTLLSLSETHVDVPCNGGNTGSINLTVTGGVSPYTYSWSNGNTSEDITALAAGSYTVTVTDANLCSKLLTVTINQNSGMTISSNLTQVKCFGNSTGAIDISVTGGVPLAGGLYTYLWNDGITTQDRINLPAGNYSVVVKDANNCTTSKNFEITQMPLIVLSTTKIDITCFGSSNGSIDLTVSGGTGNYAYTWSNGATSQDISNLVAGTYTVTVTDGNLCTKTASVTLTQPAAGSIGNFTWIDANANGIYDSGELPLDGISVKLYNANPDGTPNGAAIASATTSNGGIYNFPNVCLGNYVIEFGTTGNYVRTTQPNNLSKDPTDSDANPITGFTGIITMTAGENDPTNDAGFYIPASLGDFVWEDKNANGVQDSGDLGIAGATVVLNGTTGAGNTINLTTTTNSNGLYSFNNLAPGNYTVTFAKPIGFTNASPIDQGGNDTVDSDANLTTGVAASVNLLSGDNNTTIDAGFYNPASLGDYVWEDINANGQQDSNEPFIAGVTVTLLDQNGNQALDINGNPVPSTSTNGAGLYSFNNLKPNSPYVVSFTKPAGFVSTTANLGNDNTDSDANLVDGKSQIILLSSGENNPTIDAGYYKPASLGDFVWDDKNANGIQDGGESGIVGVLVTLTGTDGAGNIINSTTTTGSNGQYAFNNLAPGNYVVTFTKPLGYITTAQDQGGNDGTDSDANITSGATTTITLVSGENNTTIDAGYYKPASLGDFVWEDKNANGQQNLNEPAIAGVIVSLLDAAGNQAVDYLGNLVPSTTTNTSGFYEFTNLKPGIEYIVKFTTPQNYIPTRANEGLDASDSDASTTTGMAPSVILSSGENNTTIDAGYYLPASLGDFVWEDKNANGIQDNGEPGIVGALVSLTGTDAAGNPISTSTTTDSNGLYSFSNLAPGNYTVIFTKPTGFTNSSPSDLGGNDSKDSDANVLTGIAPPVTLLSGDNNISIDAGYYKPASLGDFVWEDKNANGQQDNGELPIANVTVSLQNSAGGPALDINGNIVSNTTTNSSGIYSFTNLKPGTDYVVVFTAPIGYVPSIANSGNDVTDSDANILNGKTSIVNLSSGENNPTLDAGYYKLGSIGDYVWEDKNANGVQDGNESGIANVTVTLSGTDGTGNPISLTTTTGSNGQYLFPNLAPGNYTITFTKPAGYTASPIDLGGNDATDSDANIVTGVTSLITLNSGENNLTIDAGFYKPASLGDYVWEDKNANGQQDLGEPIIAGVTVSLEDINGNQAFDNDGNPVSSTVTNASGLYNFGNLKPGIEYIVKFTTPVGFVNTSTNIGNDQTDSDVIVATSKTTAIILASGENNITIDAGYYKPARLGDFVFEDKNANGVQDSTDPGISGATVQLSGTDASGNIINLTTNTNSSGLYAFENLSPGNYQVTFVKPVGYNSTSPVDQGGNDLKDSDANPSTGIAPALTIVSGDNITTIDAGYYNSASLGDFVWEDKNGNGQQDLGEPIIAGVVVNLEDATGNVALDNNGNPVASTTTNSSGIYSFTNLKPGVPYVVVFTKPAGYTTTATNQGNELTDSDASIVNGKAQPVTLISGENNPTIDAGYYLPASLGDFVWEDKNANGVQDSGENGIANVIVTLSGTDGAGNPISTTTTTNSAGAYNFTNLAPGSYTVTFNKPAGYTASPTDLGGDDTKDSDANTTTGVAPAVTLVSGENNTTIDAGFFKPASLGDYVWEDKNANGQQDLGEPVIAGVVVNLEDATGNPATDINGNVVASTTTNSSGIYSFTNLKPGVEYVVKFTAPNGYTSTTANLGADITDSDANVITGKSQSVILSSGENNPTIDAGYYKPASLGDFVWDDKNGNGVQDDGEPGIVGAVVNLAGTDGAGNPVSLTTTTNGSGLYEFTNLVPGSYTVTFEKPAGFTLASPIDLGGNDTKDSDANPTTGVAPTVTLVSGDNNTTIDAGFYKPASLGDFVWLDKNANGVQDTDEVGIPNVIVSLNGTNSLGVPVTTSTTTGPSGEYSFTNLLPGNYTVTFTKPNGYITTPADKGGNDLADSDANTITGIAPSVTLVSGENNPTIDAGYYLPASLGDFVWEDKNANGVQDSGENGIANVIVTLSGTDGAGNPISTTTTTNSAGAYNFTNLAPGSYTVTFNKPAGYTASPTDLGGDDTKDSDANTTTGVAPAVTLVSGENNTTIDAGFFKPASLGDYVWEDKNANGQQDLGEPVIAGVVVNLEDATGNPATDINGNVVASTTTNTSGIYSFTNLKPGVEYVVKFTAPNGYTSTTANLGADITDSDANVTTGKSQSVILTSGENNPTIDAGYYKPANLGDFVWDDKNGNGVQDDGEPGIVGAVVNLAGTDGAGNPVSLTTTTNGSGLYEFTNLVPGSYTVTFEKPAGFTLASPIDLGGNDTKDSDANPTTGVAPTVTLVSGDNNTTIDAGFYKPASLGDFVWLDKNANGVQDTDEVGIPNVIVSLNGTNSLGVPVTTSTTTGPSGEYSFTNLLPGNYTVTFTKPNGYITTPADKSGNDLADSDANTITGIAPSVTLVSGENNPTIDAGYYLPASLGDFVWEDKNANGVQDSGENGIANVIVTLSGTDGAGNPISTTTTTNSAGAYNFTNLAPGSYTVTFNKPAGYTASPTDLGGDDTKDSDANTTTGVAPAVTLVSGENNATIDAGFFKPASLGDYVWEDKNANGQQDLDEPVIAGVVVNLNGTDGAGNPVSLSTTTNASGIYSFTNLVPGNYTVSFEKPSGYVTTSPDLGGNDLKDSDANQTTGITPTVSLASGETNTTIDAGYYLPASLGDYVWEDKNANGQQNIGEPIIAGVTVSLLDISGNQALDINGAPVSNTTTNSSGLYSFTNLKPGAEYVVKFETPIDFIPTASNIGSDLTDSDANIATGKSQTIILSSGENNQTIDAGYYKPASLGDFVWEDKNANGVQDGGELGIQGATVSLTGTDALGNPISKTTTTNASGQYLFDNLAPGNYTVIFTKPNGFTNSSTANQGGDDTKDSDANSVTGIAPTVTLVSGDNNTTVDAGFYNLSSLGNFVWEDKNANGIQDGAEPGIANVNVSLNGTDALGNSVSLSTTTNSLGAYSFNNLIPGNYFVIFTKPAGYTTTFVDKGSDDALDSDANISNGITSINCAIKWRKQPYN